MSTRLLMRAIHTAVCAAVLVFSAPEASAAPKGKPKAAASGGGGGSFCASAWREGASLTRQGKLRQAMEWMLKCAQATCKPVIRKECTARVTAIEADIPTIVPSVVDASGKAMSEVQVEMDGELLASHIDGRGIPVDPGDHMFTFKTDKGAIGTTKANIPQGQRNVTVTLNVSGAAAPAGASAAVAAAAPADSAGAGAPAESGGGAEAAVATSSEEPRARTETKSGGPGFGTYSMAVLGLAGLGGYGLLTYWGNKDNKLLEACTPDCKPSSVNHIRQLYTAGKISAAVGIAALAGATILFLTSGSSNSHEVASSGSSYQFGVAPTASGGMAAFSGSF